MALTDAQYKLLAQDVQTTEVTYRTAAAARDQARKALAAAILADVGAGGSIVIQGRVIRVNDDGGDITVTPQRVVT
jgi:2-keto-3-deoxy-6-phosphogluconate aldolase